MQREKLALESGSKITNFDIKGIYMDISVLPLRHVT